jgi:RNA polymerase sigma factor (sigma-70 family)
MTLWPNTRYSLLRRLGEPSSEDAWAEFQRVYVPTIYRYARARGLQEADAAEVVQEVMLAVHQGVVDWQPSHRPGSFRAWLSEAARRVTLRTVHHRRRAGETPGGSAIQNALVSPESFAGELEEHEEWQRWAFFQAAAEVEREVQEATWRAFWRTAIEGRSAEATARELGLSIGTVYSAKCRVLARIRRCIEMLSGGDE